MLNGENVNGMIRTEEVSSMASKKCTAGCERKAFITAEGSCRVKNVIMDGRDRYSCNLKPCNIKDFFLWHPLHVRALRRF